MHFFKTDQNYTMEQLKTNAEERDKYGAKQNDK